MLIDLVVEGCGYHIERDLAAHSQAKGALVPPMLWICPWCRDTWAWTSWPECGEYWVEVHSCENCWKPVHPYLSHHRVPGSILESCWHREYDKVLLAALPRDLLLREFRLTLKHRTGDTLEQPSTFIDPSTFYRSDDATASEASLGQRPSGDECPPDGTYWNGQEPFHRDAG